MACNKIMEIHIPGGDWFEQDLVERHIPIARVHHGKRFVDQLHEFIRERR